MAHAFFTTGNLEEGVARAQALSEDSETTVLRYINFTVDEVRDFTSAVNAASASGSKTIIISAARLYDAAQDALLKTFEEPPEGVTLVLVVSSEAVLIPTLRSRMVRLPDATEHTSVKADEFLALSSSERKKWFDKLYDRSKSPDKEEKRRVRKEALELVQELTQHFYNREEIMKGGILEELTFFVRILHDSSAPLKPIFEHLLIVLPEGSALPKARV